MAASSALTAKSSRHLLARGWPRSLPRPYGPLLAPLAIALLTAVTFWRSTSSVAPLLGADNVSGLIPAIPLLAVWLAIATARNRARAGQRLVGIRETVFDIPVAAVLLGVSGWLMLAGPDSLGWYYWAHRLDLLAAALFALGVAVVLFGAVSLYYYRAAAVLSLLLWPELLSRLQDALAGPLALATALLARPVAGLLGAHLQPIGLDPTVFVGAADPHWLITIGDVCSGLNAALTVPLVCVPFAAQMGLPLRRATGWLLTGVGLALLANVLRVVLLLLDADRFGVAMALGTLHPLLGDVLLIAVFLALYLLLPTARPNHASHSAPAPASRALPHPRLAAATLLAGVAVFGLASNNLAAFDLLPPLGAPGGDLLEPLDYLSLPAGWHVRGASTMPWQNLFGPDSKSYALSFESDQGAVVKAQYVATADRGALETYDLEACRVYHGDSVLASANVPLVAGAVARLVDTDDASGQMSVLFWEAPIRVQGREMQVRLALFAQDEDTATYPVSPSLAGIAPAGSTFDRADSELVSLARQVTRNVLANQG